MNPPRWTPYVACAAVVLIVSSAYFLFPNTQTKVVTNRVAVDPYAKYLVVDESEEQITPDGLIAHCVVSESRKGVRDNPQDGDVIVQVCRASRKGPTG